MTIAVIAVSGQLGSTIAKALIATGQGGPIVGLARSPDRVTIPGLDVRPGDYANAQGMKDALAGVQTLLMVSLNTPPDIRTDQHRTAINAAKEAGVKRIVYTSVQGAEQGTAFSPVVQSNRQTETDLKDSGLDWSIGRNGI